MGYIPPHTRLPDSETDFFFEGGGDESLPLVGLFAVLLGGGGGWLVCMVAMAVAVALRLPFAVCRGALLVAVAPRTRVRVCMRVRVYVCTCVRVYVCTYVVTL